MELRVSKYMRQAPMDEDEKWKLQGHYDKAAEKVINKNDIRAAGLSGTRGHFWHVLMDWRSYMKNKHSHFPLFIDISKMNILVIGAGQIACRRIETLLLFDSHITVVSPEIRKSDSFR